MNSVAVHTTKLKIIGASLVTCILSMTYPAVAASSSCVIKPWIGSCPTGTVAANSSGHFVFIHVSPNSNYTVTDETTKAVVATGTAGWLPKKKTIFGLYGNQYKLTVTNPIGGGGYINNN